MDRDEGSAQRVGRRKKLGEAAGSQWVDMKLSQVSVGDSSLGGMSINAVLASDLLPAVTA